MDYKNSIKIKNFILLGTSHISKQSLDDIGYLVYNAKPDFIAIELDPGRYHSLLQKEKPKFSFKLISQLGVKGYIFSIIASWAEKKLGEITGFPPGSEMKYAIQLAKRKKIKIALIDQEIQITLKKFSKSITWREKFTFLIDILKGVFKRDKTLEFDIRTVPSQKLIKKLVSKLKKSYPSVYKILISERNKVMADNLKKMSKENPDKLILVVVGAGHLDGMLKLLK